MRLLSPAHGLSFLVFVGSAVAGLAAAPKLVVKERAHDFGTVQQGQPLETKLEFTNSGDAVLHVVEFTPSCGCTTTGNWPHELKPGESASVPVKVETAHFIGPIEKTVLLRTDDPTEDTLYFELRAKIATPISINAPVLIFPAAEDPNQPMSRSTTLRDETDEPLKLTAPISDNPLFRPELKTVIPDKEYELIVTTGTPLPEGTHSARITMNSTLTKQPNVTVEAVATLLAATQIAPNQIMLSSAKLSAPEKRFAVVMSHRGPGIQLRDLTTDAPGAELTSAVSPDGKQVAITITFPTGFEFKPGATYALRGHTNQPSLPNFEIPIVFIGPR